MSQSERGGRDAESHRVVEFHFVDEAEQHGGGERVARAGGVEDGRLDGGDVAAGLGGGVDHAELRQGDEGDVHAGVEQGARGFERGAAVGRFEDLTCEGRGLRDVARDEAQFTEIRLQPLGPQRGGGIGANGDFRFFRQRERGFERGFGQVAVHEDEAGFLKEFSLPLEVFGREFGHDAHIVHCEAQAGARVEDAHVKAGGIEVGAQDGGHIHPSRGGVLEQLVSRTILSHHADEFGGLSQPRQVFGHVARHASIRGADARRVGGAGFEVGVEASDDVEGGGAEEEEGWHGEKFILVCLTLRIIYAYT